MLSPLFLITLLFICIAFMFRYKGLDSRVYAERLWKPFEDALITAKLDIWSHLLHSGSYQPLLIAATLRRRGIGRESSKYNKAIRAVFDTIIHFGKQGGIPDMMNLSSIILICCRLEYHLEDTFDSSMQLVKHIITRHYQHAIDRFHGKECHTILLHFYPILLGIIGRRWCDLNQVAWDDNTK